MALFHMALFHMAGLSTKTDLSTLAVLSRNLIIICIAGISGDKLRPDPLIETLSPALVAEMYYRPICAESSVLQRRFHNMMEHICTLF